jgi:ABC-type bacteriocin/lantibiotic exporter with double-glycine peptidase domain
MKLFIPIQLFSSLSLTFQPILVALKRLGYIFETKLEEELWGNKKAETIEGAISFQSVSFSYDKQNKSVLQDCNFSINPGECVAILGTNGSGKTTILKLILGFYNDYQGRIYFNDSELHEYNIASLRNRIGIVSQNIFLFKGNLKENVKIANFGASEQDIERAIELSGCKKIFSNEIGTIKVEEFGRNLSGGQKQAAAIARCLLKDSDLLLFDEATTHLDEATRATVLRAIRETFVNKTRIIISHDRDIANMADRILWLENGKTTFLSTPNLIH